MPGLFAVAGLLLIALGGWQWLRDPPRYLCPGPRLPWAMRLMPLWLICRPRCGYNLTGHTFDARGSISCPECGRQVRRKREMVRTPRAWHPARLGCVFIATGALVHRYPPLTAATIVQHTPTNMLLRGEGLLGAGTPLEVRAEIRRRAMEHELDDAQVSQLVRLLVTDLKDDYLIGNARDALERLAIFGVIDSQPLFNALNSPDAQQRALAAEVLRCMPHAHGAHEALLRASIADLRSDDQLGNRRSARGYLFQHLEQATPLLIEWMFSDDAQQQRDVIDLLRTARTEGPVLESLLRASIADLRSDRQDYRGVKRGFEFLLRHAEVAEALLREGMSGDDAQQRLLCAAVAGCGGRVDLLDRAAPILISHLADNTITGDAIIAARALFGFGAPMLPILQSYRHSPDEQQDEQQRQAVEYIVRRMTTGKSLVQLQRELPRARLTLAAKDALELEPASLNMPRFP